MAAAPSPRIVIFAATSVLAVAGALTAKWEGTSHPVYLDPVGIPTVCEGHTEPSLKLGQVYTDAQCAAFKAADLAVARHHVNRCLPMPKLPQIEGALTDAVFNLGPRVVCGSTLQQRALANDWPGACAQLDRWKLAAGRVLEGLKNRRSDDRAFCEGRAQLVP